MKKITFAYAPETLEQFCALPQLQDTTKPENTCALFLMALHLFTVNKQQGIEAINMLRGPRPMSRFDEQFLAERLSDKKYLPMVYFDGATPQNGYVPSKPLTVTLYEDPRPQDCPDGYMRVIFKTAGADSPRNIMLRTKPSTGEWFLWEYPGLLVSVRIPVAEDPWA